MKIETTAYLMLGSHNLNPHVAHIYADRNGIHARAVPITKIVAGIAIFNFEARPGECMSFRQTPSPKTPEERSYAVIGIDGEPMWGYTMHQVINRMRECHKLARDAAEFVPVAPPKG